MKTVKKYRLKWIILLFTSILCYQNLLAQANEETAAEKIANDLSISVERAKDIVILLQNYDIALRDILQNRGINEKDRHVKIRALYKERLESVSRHLSEEEFVRFLEISKNKSRLIAPAPSQDAGAERLNDVSVDN